MPTSTIASPATTPAERILRPFQEFARIESAAGLLLLLSAALALAWANSPYGAAYFEVANAALTVGIGSFTLSKPLLLWINDGLMAVFFLVVGLEIKREILVGELSSPRKAALSIVAALGGMVVPAAIYASLNAGTEGAAGWGIPMATDIAFAIGVLTLLGSRVPIGLKIFLTALAIADDLGAVLVIAIFYTSEIDIVALGAAAAALVLLAAANRARFNHPGFYAIVGALLWLAVLKSGVHATVAGVALAMTIPSRSRIDGAGFLARTRSALDAFERHRQPGAGLLTNAEQQAALHTVETACEQALPPLQRLEHGLHPWVMFVVMPVFAFFNAAVVFRGSLWEAVSRPATLGVILGLVIGKPVGIILFSWIAVRAGIATLPDGAAWRHMLGVACLAGIGFTMSLFIAGLAFDGALLDAAKVGILVASATAGVVGLAVLWSVTARDRGASFEKGR